MATITPDMLNSEMNDYNNAMNTSQYNQLQLAIQQLGFQYQNSLITAGTTKTNALVNDVGKISMGN